MFCQGLLKLIIVCLPSESAGQVIHVVWKSQVVAGSRGPTQYSYILISKEKIMRYARLKLMLIEPKYPAVQFQKLQESVNEQLL